MNLFRWMTDTVLGQNLKALPRRRLLCERLEQRIVLSTSSAAGDTSVPLQASSIDQGWVNVAPVITVGDREFTFQDLFGFSPPPNYQFIKLDPILDQGPQIVISDQSYSVDTETVSYNSTYSIDGFTTDLKVLRLYDAFGNNGTGAAGDLDAGALLPINPPSVGPDPSPGGTGPNQGTQPKADEPGGMVSLAEVFLPNPYTSRRRNLPGTATSQATDQLVETALRSQHRIIAARGRDIAFELSSLSSGETVRDLPNNGPNATRGSLDESSTDEVFKSMGTLPDPSGSEEVERITVPLAPPAGEKSGNSERQKAPPKHVHSAEFELLGAGTHSQPGESNRSGERESRTLEELAYRTDRKAHDARTKQIRGSWSNSTSRRVSLAIGAGVIGLALARPPQTGRVSRLSPPNAKARIALPNGHSLQQDTQKAPHMPL